jgi:hypothetical protein
MLNLTPLLKNIRDVKVNTRDYLNKSYLEDFVFFKYPKEATHIWLDDAVQNRDLQMVIGGYGDVNSEKGAGYTRLVPNAEYGLHLFATQSNMKLTMPVKVFPLSFGAPSDEMQVMADYIIEHCDDGLRSISKPKHVVYVQADMMIRENGANGIPKDSPGRFLMATGEEVVTNVHKKGLSYYGDITLHVSAPTVLGSNCLEAKDFTGEESLRTDAVLFSRSMAGSGLRQYMERRRNILSHFADESKIKYDSRSWLLLVNNIN